MRDELRRVCRGLPLRITGMGSLFKVSAIDEELSNYRSTLHMDVGWQEVASLALLSEGFLLTTQLHGCLATTTTDEQIERLLATFDRIVHTGA